MGVKIGSNREIFQGIQIIGNGEVTIGNNVFIGSGARIMTNEGGSVVVEDYAIIGAESFIVTGYHPVTGDCPRIHSYEGRSGNCTIKRGAALGTRCILLPNRTLGEMSEALAGCVKIHDVPAYTRVAGVPAGVILRHKHE